MGGSLKELEVIVQRKQMNVRTIEEGMSVPSPLKLHDYLDNNVVSTVLRQKIMASQAEGQS